MVLATLLPWLGAAGLQLLGASAHTVDSPRRTLANLQRAGLGALLRLQGGSSAGGARGTPAAAPLALENGVLRVADSRGTLLLDGLSTALRGTPSPSGGLFIDSGGKSGRNNLWKSGGKSGYNRLGRASALDLSLGSLRCHRLLACARVTRYWMGPSVGALSPHTHSSEIRHTPFLPQFVTPDVCLHLSHAMICSLGAAAADVPHDTQFLLLELQEGGPYALLLPLIDGDARSSLHGVRRRFLGGSKKRSEALRLHVETGRVSHPFPPILSHPTRFPPVCHTSHLPHV